MVAWFDFRTARGVETRVEILFSVYGPPPDELEKGAALIQNRDFGLVVRLPNPLVCLKMKTHNAVGLDQARRQDVKQVNMLILCNRAFLRDILRDGESGVLPDRSLINALEALFCFVTSPIAERATQRFSFSWGDAFPMKELAGSSLARVQSFVSQRLLPRFPSLRPGGG